ncbi:unnamed protein product [Rotaria magnacalcarata]|uniref:Uncharacterized protein n=1 Tax=Rotaria magnacalcarata TaxID=392030 RepID=A0A816MKW4_9BILA|nr:unnamed protein product [Rotaria magnacalcarata]
MSTGKRPNTLLSYHFSSKKKIRNDTENLTPNLNAPAPAPATTATTITTNNDDSNAFLSSDPEDLDQVSEEVNVSVETNELKIINSRPDTNKNDIGYYASSKLLIDDNLKYSLLTKHFKPDRKYSFPTLYSDDHKHSRRFLINWLNDNSFLVYSPYIEGAYCINCVLFRNVQGQKLELFVDKPCQQYKHLKHFTTSFKRHINSQFHQNSTVTTVYFIRTYKDPSLSILSLLDKDRIDKINRNQAILSSIVKISITCSRQNISLRDHRDETIDDVRKIINVINSHSGSDFIAFLKQRIDAGDEVLHEHIEHGPKNALYTKTVSCTGETIANIILDYLSTNNLPFDNCIGQAYDGGSNMAGIYRGCQAFIKKKCPDAEYYHCSNHCLNLALADSCSISQIRSPKGMNALRTEITDYQGEYVCLTNKERLISLCETRWVDRINTSIETFLELYIPIVNTLDKFRYGTLKNPTAEQLCHAINNFQHVTSTSISCFLLSEIAPVSRMLQTETLDFSSANRYIDDLLDKLEQQKYDA